MSRDIPKSDIFTTSPSPTRQFRVARSRWTKCCDVKYFIPFAIWMAISIKSIWKGEPKHVISGLDIWYIDKLIKPRSVYMKTMLFQFSHSGLLSVLNSKNSPWKKTSVHFSCLDYRLKKSLNIRFLLRCNDYVYIKNFMLNITNVIDNETNAMNTLNSLKRSTIYSAKDLQNYISMQMKRFRTRHFGQFWRDYVCLF